MPKNKADSIYLINLMVSNQLNIKQINPPVMKAKIEQISELGARLSDKSNITGCLTSIFKRFYLGNILKALSMDKQKGFSCAELLLLLCVFRINQDSVHSWHKHGYYDLFDGEKNCFYRILSSSKMDWRKLLNSIRTRFEKIVLQESKTDAQVKQNPTCLIIDDTTLAKTGKMMESIGMVFDHVTGRMILGYKLLALAIFDGTSTIVTDFSIHSESGKNGNRNMKRGDLDKQFSKERADSFPSKIRFNEISMSKIDTAIQMIKRAVTNGVTAQYVLADSWFMCESLLRSVRALKRGAIHVVGLCKLNRTRYKVQEKEMNASEIIAKYERNRIKYSRKFRCSYMVVKCDYKGIPVKLFLIRYGRQAKWSVLLTTNQQQTFQETFEIYQIRWNIEVLFKECKQYLGLGSNQSRDFDVQIADATLAFMTHCMLTLQKRFSDYETFGELFKEMQEELYLTTLWRRILTIITHILERISHVLNRTYEEVLQLLWRDEEMGKQICTLFSLVPHSKAD